jgi:N-acetylglucosaminyldiphosphoundecaprenol N-acetyl-beta-D-mannosaminyltransferase
MTTVDILGITVSPILTEEILTRIEQTIREGGTLTIYPVNVNVVMKSRTDPEFRETLNASDIATSDGVPIVWASKFMGGTLKEKKTGWILFENICKTAAENGYRLFFLGGAPGIPERAARTLKKSYPGLSVSGVYSPPWGFESNPEENHKIVELINEATPHIVFVGLGAPKQEKWIRQHMGETRANVFMAVGGSFDFFSGKIRRPPLFVVRIGLGWVWRILQEPRRLWRRYLIEDSPFLYHILRERFSPRAPK